MVLVLGASSWDVPLTLEPPRGYEFEHRMDRRDLEPCYWLLEGQSWMRTLLRGTDGESFEADGAGKLPKRLSSCPPAADAGCAPELERAKAHLCQLHE